MFIIYRRMTMYTALVVDDEQELRQAIIESVDWEKAGFRVVGDAGNGIDALELAEKLEPDLILTDIKMPMMTGLELAKQVRELRPGDSGRDTQRLRRFRLRESRYRIQYNRISAETDISRGALSRT